MTARVVIFKTVLRFKFHIRDRIRENFVFVKILIILIKIIAANAKCIVFAIALHVGSRLHRWLLLRPGHR